MRNGMFATLEDQLGSQVQVSEGPVVPEVVAEVSEGSAELVQDAGEVSDLVAQVEDATVADQELTAIADNMQASVDAGTGLGEDAAQMAEIATESIMNRLGLRNHRIMPATENFGSSNSRVAATRVACESVMETVKKVWEGIMDFLKMVWQKISDFFSKFFDNSDKVEAAAKELRSEVQKISTKTMLEKKFDSGAVSKAFNVGGKSNVSTMEEVLKTHRAAIAGVTKVFKNGTSLTEYVLSNTGSAEKVKAFDINEIAKITNELFESAGLGISGTEKAGKEGGKTTSTTTFGPFVNGQLIAVKKVSNDKGVSSLSVESKEVEKEPSDKNVPTMTVEQMNSTLANVISIATEVTAFKKDQEKINKIGGDLEKAVGNIISAVGKASEDDAIASEKLAAIKEATKTVTSVVSRFSVMIPSMNVKAANAALLYVRGSIKQYGDKKAA